MIRIRLSLRLLILILLICFIPSVSKANETQNLLSEEYIKCSAFTASSSKVLEKNYADLSNRLRYFSKDSLVRGLAAFQLEFPSLNQTQSQFHIHVRFKKYEEIWDKSLKNAGYKSIKGQLLSCRELLPEFDIKIEDFIKSLAV